MHCDGPQAFELSSFHISNFVLAYILLEGCSVVGPSIRRRRIENEGSKFKAVVSGVAYSHWTEPVGIKHLQRAR
jgi:hypothetical protein